MPNKKINALDVKVAVSTDLMLVGDPTTGTAYKSTLATLPLVPYTGATGSVLLGLYGLTAGTLTLQEQPLNGSTYKLTQRMASNDYWSIYGFATVADEGDLFFELQDNAAFANGQRFRFHYGNASSGTPKDILLMDYNGATIDGSVQVNTLAGTGTRMVISDANGALSTQSIPSLSSGGSSVAYYLNGGTAASVGTYYQMSTTAVLGAAADFNLVGNGLISQFLTDVNDPNRLEIPGGNWNFEMYFNISSSGGNTAFYVELLKYDGTTFTSIASNVGTPEEITGGTSIDLYLTSLAIPQTTLLATDRLALRVYIVNNSGGRTVTLHTQDSHLCEIITNFAGGVSALNGLTANTQYFATGTSGTDFAISSVSDTHTFNLPTASATNRGALSSADWSTFNNKQAALTLTTTGTSGAATLVGATLNIPQYSGGGGGSMAIGGAITSATAGSVLFAGTSGVLQQDNANFFWDDTNNRLGIGTATPTATLQVNNSVVGDSFVVNGASSSALLFNTDSFGRVSINVSSNPSATAQSGAYFTANGHEEAWFNVVARAASTGNKYWRFGNTGGGNTFAIQKLNDTATAVTFTALQISSAGIVQTNDSFNVNKNQNASTNIEINNTTSGTNADCSFKANSNSGSFGQFGKFSTLRTTYKTLTGLDTYVYNNPVGGDISLLNDFGIGKIKFAAGASSTAQATLTAAGRLLLGTVTESTYLLDVNGTARVSGEILFDSNLKFSTNEIYLYNPTSTRRNVVITPNFGLQTFTGITNVYIGSVGSILTASNNVVAIGGLGNTPSAGSVVIGGTSTISASGSILLSAGSNGNAASNSIVLQTNHSVSFYATQVRTLAAGQFATNCREWYVGSVNGFTGVDANANNGSINGEGASGTDKNGGILTIAGGKGTGSGASGDVIISTATPTTTGTALQTLTERVRIFGSTGNVRFAGVIEETITTNRQTASYSLVLADRGKLVEMNSASANTLTIPLNSSIAFPIGSKIDVTQYGAGATTITATGGVTIRSFTSFLKIAGQYAACTLVKIGTDEWYCYGNLIA